MIEATYGEQKLSKPKRLLRLGQVRSQWRRIRVFVDGFLCPMQVTDTHWGVHFCPFLVVDACVSLYVYDTDKCTGTPRRTVTYPTWQKPGSQCFHDVSMDHISVKDQYCNAETGNWHQTVFMGSADCSKKWWNSRFELTYTTDSCIGGYQLAECHLDPCSQTEPINDDKEVLESIVMAIAMAVD
uniref:Uncharacterized protein n=1 Tax=Amphora coffeiformis TaxID=265554 RepID=A0A7S3L8P8_9STRA|mmetsp:Transcript_1746/g.3827  ORF Transcript_1746/g.3827 Transcript_1746/m.3827 type:complete len:184 (-) Transcript_1746:153-704(-)